MLVDGGNKILVSCRTRKVRIIDKQILLGHKYDTGNFISHSVDRFDQAIRILKKIFPDDGDLGLYGWIDDCAPKDIVQEARQFIKDIKDEGYGGG